MNKPDILEVISGRVELRKVGREYKGLCPFHTEKTASFSVNPEKQVFYCHGCLSGGDVVEFIMKLDDLPFHEACAQLGIKTDRKPPAPDPLRQTAHLITQWANEHTARALSLLREIDEQLRLATALHWHQEIQILRLQESFLAELAEDLQNPTFTLSLWESCEWVETLTEGAANHRPSFVLVMLKLMTAKLLKGEHCKR
jgi:CHC2 zinc finger